MSGQPLLWEEISFHISSPDLMGKSWIILVITASFLTFFRVAAFHMLSTTLSFSNAALFIKARLFKKSLVTD